MNTLAVFGLGGQEIMLILLAVLILFGAKKIPEFARGLGQGIKEFRKASREIQEEIERAAQEEPTQTARTSQPSSEPGYAEPDLHNDTYPDGTSPTEPEEPQPESHSKPGTTSSKPNQS